MNPREWQFFNCFKRKTGFDLVPQPCRFMLNDGLPLAPYIPDFFCYENFTFYEVVGSKQAYSAGRRKYGALKAKYPELKLELVNPDGSRYVAGKQRQLKPLRKSAIWLT